MKKLNNLEGIHADVVEIINRAKGLKPEAMKRYLIEQIDMYFKSKEGLDG